MKDKYFSVDHEPALSGGRGTPDPAEQKAAPVGRPASELESLRDSVASEPALPDRHDPEEWTRWLQQKRGQCTLPGNLGVTLLAALLGGPFAIVGAMIYGRPGTGPLVYAVLFAPVIEELLKQSGMTFVLERMPYRIFASWQFLFAAVVSGLTFGAVENLVYLVAFMARDAGESNREAIAQMAAFRWAVCTPLHVAWAAIASLGLARAWRRQVRNGRPAELAAAFPFFVAAMALHGLYNLWAVVLGPEF